MSTLVRLIKEDNSNYTNVSNEVIKDDKLSWKARGIFVYLWSQSNNWNFYVSEIAKHSPGGEASLRSGLKELEGQGYLKRVHSHDKKGGFDGMEWILHDHHVKNCNDGKIEQNKPKMLEKPSDGKHIGCENHPMENRTLITNNNNNYQYKQLINRNIYSCRSQTNDPTPNQKQDDPVKQVIDYLNKKTGRVKSRDQFSYRTKQYRSLINARIKDGYTLSDFKRVIDNKCCEWLHDPDMTRFLRPSTLFRPINFNQYLKEKPVKPRIRSQGKKIVEQGTDWSKKKAKVSGDLMSDAQMDAIFNSFGNSSLGGQQ